MLLLTGSSGGPIGSSVLRGADRVSSTKFTFMECTRACARYKIPLEPTGRTALLYNPVLGCKSETGRMEQSAVLLFYSSWRDDVN